MLRGIAVLAVIITHLPHSSSLGTHADASGANSALPAWITQWTHYGQYGVHLFLVLSGFCIHLRWVRVGALDAKIDFLPFWKRRLHRLYPPYFVALLGTLAALFVFHGVLHGTYRQGLAAALGYTSTTKLAIDLALLVLLMQNVNRAADRIGNGPFWSLALEEQLYMLYFPMLAIRRRFGWLATFSLALASSVAWRVAVTILPLPTGIAWFLLGPSRWFEWVLGALAVVAHYERVTLPSWIRHPAHIVAAALLALASAPPKLWFPTGKVHLLSDLVFGWFFFTLVHAMTSSKAVERASNDSRLLRALGSVGVASYSLYLTHEPTLVVAKWIALKLHAPTPVVVAFRFALAMAVGYAFHYLVERRFIHASRPTPTNKPECVATAG